MLGFAPGTERNRRGRGGGECFVWVLYCVGVLVICILYSEVYLNLTEGFPCFFLSCKANAKVKLAKTGHSAHFSKLVIWLVRLLFVLFCVLFVCKCVLPPGDSPVAVNNYIIEYQYEEARESSELSVSRFLHGRRMQLKGCLRFLQGPRNPRRNSRITERPSSCGLDINSHLL
jgi:fumarate reductase subunit D